MVKFPVLFQHFYEHQLLNSEITFAEYLVDHYNSVPHTDNDEERDLQLPFKTLDLSGLLTPAIPQWYRSYFQKHVRLIAVNDAFRYQESHIPAPDAGKIWQPPKA